MKATDRHTRSTVGSVYMEFALALPLLLGGVFAFVAVGERTVLLIDSAQNSFNLNLLAAQTELESRTANVEWMWRRLEMLPKATPVPGVAMDTYSLQTSATGDIAVVVASAASHTLGSVLAPVTTKTSSMELTPSIVLTDALQNYENPQVRYGCLGGILKDDQPSPDSCVGCLDSTGSGQGVYPCI